MSFCLFRIFTQLRSKCKNETVFFTTASPRRQSLPIAALSCSTFLSSSFSNPGLRITYENSNNNHSYNNYNPQGALKFNKPSIRSSLNNEKKSASNHQNNLNFRLSRFKVKPILVVKNVALCVAAYYCGSRAPEVISAIVSIAIRLGRLKIDIDTDDSATIAGKVVENLSNFESAFDLTKKVNKERKIKETKITMDIIAEQKRAHYYLLDLIDNDTSLRARLQSAFVSDFTYYGQNESATLCRLEMMLQLFEDRKIDICKHYFERGSIQPISNLYVATNYLSWWFSEYSLKKSSDLFIQSFLSNIALLTKTLNNNIEDVLKLDEPFDNVKNEFILFRIIGEAISYFRTQIIILKSQPSFNEVSSTDCFSNELKQKLIFESFYEGFRKVSQKRTFISYDHEEIAKLFEEVLQTYFID